MTLVERLRLWAESLPPNGSVTLTRPDLVILLEEAGDDSVQTRNRGRSDCTVKEVAIRFGRSEQTVRDWINGKKLQAYRLGREWRITPAELAEFEERLRSGDTSRRSSEAALDLRAWRKVT